jgi:hypothetical protein
LVGIENQGDRVGGERTKSQIVSWSTSHFRGGAILNRNYREVQAFEQEANELQGCRATVAFPDAGRSICFPADQEREIACIYVAGTVGRHRHYRASGCAAVSSDFSI